MNPRSLAWSLLAICVLHLPWLNQPVRAQDPAPSPDSPALMVHYMPWYQAKPLASNWGWHWTMNHFNPDRVDESGRREIASHYYPEIGPYDSRDGDVLEYHTLLMVISGIDGVIVDWYGTGELFDYPFINVATQRLFEVVRKAGLKFAICYEDQTVQHLINAGRISSAQAIEHAQQDMLYVQNTWMRNPAYLTLQDRPVLLNFGPQYFRTSSQWDQIFDPLDVDPQFFPQDHRLAPGAEGAFPWPPMHLSTNGTLSLDRARQYLDQFYRTAQNWPHFVGGAFPGFHDIYEEAGIGASYGYLDANDGLTFTQTLDLALAAEAPIIQIVTWNDFGEGTSIEPTQEYGYRYLEHVQETAAALRDAAFDARDLELPAQLFALRKEHAGDAAVGQRLDEAASFIIEGNPDQARSILASYTSVDDGGAERPGRGASLRGYPNPTQEDATLLVDLESTGHVQFDVYDALGRRVALLASGILPEGSHRFTWSTNGQPGGVYFARLQFEGEVESETLLLQR